MNSRAADADASSRDSYGSGRVAAVPDRRPDAAPLQDETRIWDFLERLQAIYREVVIILLGHIQGSDMLTAAERAEQLDRLLDELHGIANALRDAVR
jgi:hypothetical protein